MLFGEHARHILNKPVHNYRFLSSSLSLTFDNNHKATDSQVIAAFLHLLTHYRIYVVVLVLQQCFHRYHAIGIHNPLLHERDEPVGSVLAQTEDTFNTG